MSRSINQRVHPVWPVRPSQPVRLLWLSAWLLTAAGCITPALSVPSAEVERMLALPPSTTGLTPAQSASLRSLLTTSKLKRRVLELHLDGESLRLKRLLGDGEPVMGPAIVAQAGLVYQLRTEWLLETGLLRERARELLTPEQQMWWVRNRLKVIDPR